MGSTCSRHGPLPATYMYVQLVQSFSTRLREKKNKFWKSLPTPPNQRPRLRLQPVRTAESVLRSLLQPQGLLVGSRSLQQPSPNQIRDPAPAARNRMWWLNWCGPGCRKGSSINCQISREPANRPAIERLQLLCSALFRSVLFCSFLPCLVRDLLLAGWLAFCLCLCALCESFVLCRVSQTHSRRKHLVDLQCPANLPALLCLKRWSD
ncbi:hypothetical protein J3F84DRAFT_190854 [Trichoderma pleuroticola]